MENLKINPRLFEILKCNEIPDHSIANIVAGAAYYENLNGVPSTEYWNNKDFDTRDEFFVILNSFFGFFSLVKRIPERNEWRLKFDVAFLFQLKSTSQSAFSINLLTSKHCYPDAFAICRTMISRLNQLILFAFNPELFDEWLKNPKDEKFLDGHIRNELTNNGISTVSHLYELTSEIIHSQYEGLVNAGYFEKGLFPEIPALRNQIFVIAKFILGMSYQTVLSMFLKDCDENNIPDELKYYNDLFEWFLKSYLVPNRIDHVFTFLAEDRHVEKVGKDKYKIGSTFNFNEVRNQIGKYHRKGQPKRLSKKYDV
ncbi:MAG: hypothetical protein FD143_2968 [Ignavibacteria bacterium]|nr:MAG: hypothetical protein FD143_2968 [Ignavibacteria bacterium]KAF0155227.1 MAG: hypothetical protein FD188_3174 [Ignavibacteria bacterium]